jgi:hypothetical protein
MFQLERETFRKELLIYTDETDHMMGWHYHKALWKFKDKYHNLLNKISTDHFPWFLSYSFPVLGVIERYFEAEVWKLVQYTVNTLFHVLYLVSHIHTKILSVCT